MTFLANYSAYNDSLNTHLLETTSISNLSEQDTGWYPTALVMPITVLYAIIFITGLLGNVSTCIVIACNKSMHTATNYYLFSLAISDLLLLISGLPPEMYRIWSPEVPNLLLTSEFSYDYLLCCRFTASERRFVCFRDLQRRLQPTPQC